MRKDVDSQPVVRPSATTPRKKIVSGIGLVLYMSSRHHKKNGRNKKRAVVHICATYARRTFVIGYMIGMRRPNKSPTLKQTMCRATKMPSLFNQRVSVTVRTRDVMPGYTQSVVANRPKILTLHGTRRRCTRHTVSQMLIWAWAANASLIVQDSTACFTCDTCSICSNAYQVASCNRAVAIKTVYAACWFWTA